jgi:hypothetical protein
MPRPPIALNTTIPIAIQRELHKVASIALSAQSSASDAIAGLGTKVSNDTQGLLGISKSVNQQLQAGGAYPLNLTGLSGSGPGPWRPYTPVLTSSAGSVTLSVNTSRYSVSGKQVALRVFLIFSVSMTSAYVTVSLPSPAYDIYQTFASTLIYSSTSVTVPNYLVGAGIKLVTSFTGGATLYNLYIQGVYEPS